jgi:TP901 family phage tail tape measure protein
LNALPGLAAGAAKQLDQQLNSGLGGAARGIDQIAQKLQALGAKRSQIEATIEIKRNALNNVVADIEKLKQQRIELKANGTAAAGEIEKIDRKLRELKGSKLKIEADFGAAKVGLEQVNGQIGQLERKIKDSERAAQRFGSLYQGVLQGVGQQLTVLAQKAAIAPFSAIGGAIEGFKEYDAQLQQFSALTGKAREDLGPLNAEIERLGLETSKSPVEVAQTANALITLGAAADGVKDQLSGVVALSEATRTGLELSGQVVQTVQNVFGESSDDIADKLTVLRNNTAASVEDVLQLASKSGGVGVSVGEDFNTLAAAFATLRDGGFTAETAGTALKTTLLALSAPSNRQAAAFKELGVSAFDAAGEFKGVEAILPELAASVEGMFDNERSNKLKRAFGSEALPALLLLLDKYDTRMAETKGRLEDFAGTAAKSSATLIEGFAGSRQLLQGSVEALGVEFGANLEPALTAGTLALNDIVSEVLNSEGLFDEMAASAQGFSDSLKENPENVKQIAGAVTGVVRVVQGEIANALNALSAFLDDSEKVDGLADAIAASGSVLSTVSDIVGALSPLIGLATKNSELFGLALQVIVVRMIAIKALSFVGALSSMISGFAAAAGGASAASLGMTGFGAATAGATTSMGAFAAASAAALGPLAALVAAVAAAQFLKFSQELRVANEEIEAIGNGAYAATGGALQLGQKIKNLNEQLAAEQRGEIQLSDEQIARAEQLKTLAEEQLKTVRAQLAAAKQIKPKNEAQRNSQTALIGQLEVSERAVKNQVDQLDVNLQARVEVDPAAVEEALPEDAEFAVDADTESAKDALEALQTASSEALAKIQQDSTARIKAVREAQRDGVKGEEEAANEIAKIQADALKDELAQKQAQLAQLASIPIVEATAATGGDDEDEDDDGEAGSEGNAKAIGEERLKLEQEISQLSLGIVEAEVEEKKKLREKELADLKRANAQADAAIARSQQDRITAIRQTQLDGSFDEEQAAEEIAQIERDAVSDRLAQKQQELAQVASLQARGLLSAEEAADQQIALNAEVGQLNLERIEKEIAAQKALADAQEEAALEQIQNTHGRDAAGLGVRAEQGRGQLDLLSAQAELSKSLGELENGRLQTQIASAESAGDVAGAEALRSRLIEQQSRQFEQQAKLQQRQLILQQQIQQVELERAKVEAEIALAEAEAKGESERVLALRQQQVKLANEAIARQAEINQAQRDGLTAQQEVTREQEKQAQLADEQNRKEQERARLLGIISGQLNETDAEQAQSALDNASERFDLAAGAGLVGRGDRQAFSGALRDVESLVESGASDETLLREAIENRDNDIFQQLLKDIGRGDIVDLAQLSPAAVGVAEDLRPVGLRQDAIAQQFEAVQSGGATGLDAVGAQIVREIQAVRGLLERNLARPYQLSVQTSEDPGLAAAGVYAAQQKAALAALGG